MKRSGFRFTVRRLMLWVAIVGVILGVEIHWVRFAKEFVSEHDGESIRNEAITVWAIPHAVIGCIYFVSGEIRDRRERRDECRSEDAS